MIELYATISPQISESGRRLRQKYGNNMFPYVSVMTSTGNVSGPDGWSLRVKPTFFDHNIGWHKARLDPEMCLDLEWFGRISSHQWTYEGFWAEIISYAFSPVRSIITCDDKVNRYNILMSWLFFQDESGQDHKNTPLEVRGGVAIHSNNIWNFVQSLQKAEIDCFGMRLLEVGSEIKGSKLLERKRCNWALQEETMAPNARKNGARRFLTKSQQKAPLSRREFTAFGQASKAMAHRVFDALRDHEAVIFASVIPRIKPPKDYQYSHFLRKDLIFLQERFYWFLEAKQESGLLVLDQVEKESGKRYLKRLQDYYTKTEKGRRRSKWIVPYPLFVDSELSLGAQAADLCLYCINWGFRRNEWKFKGPKREDIHAEFAGRCGDLQFSGDSVEDGRTRRLFGINYVSDPYSAKPRPK